MQSLAETRGFALWSAAAFPQDVELSAGLLLDLGHAMARSVRPEVAQRGADLVADLAEVSELSGLSGLSGLPVAGDPHRRRRLLVLDAVDRLAALCEDGPALLALEDLHWCDELSLEVVAQLARRLPSLPLCVVATLRSDELHHDAPARAWRSRLLSQRMAEEAPLARLDREQTEQLVEALLGRSAPARVVRLVRQRSGGVPLHVEELVRAAAQGRLSESFVPETLADAVQQRFQQLSPAAQSAAVAAAVVRRSFDLDLLVAVTGLAPDDAAATVDELTTRHFVQEEAPRWFGFRHALIRDAIEAGASLAQRRELHSRVAEVARHRPELGGDAYRSAHHEAAGELADAAAAASAAAERATALSAHQEAYELLHRAVRCRPDADADLVARRAVEAAATDHNAQAADDYVRARELRVAAGDLLGAAALLPGLVAVRHLLGDPLATRIAMLERGFADLERATDAEDRARVRGQLDAAVAAAYLVDDRLDEAVAAGERALASAQDESGRLDSAATLGAALVLAGRGDEGWPRLEATTLRASELGLEAEAARGYRMVGSSASTMVEYDRAEVWLREGIEYAARTELWNHRDYMASHLAHVAWCTGRWTEAEQTVRQVLAEGEGGITTRITALHVTGFLALGRGQHSLAESTLREAREAGEEMGELQRYSPAVWGLAELALLQQRHGESVALTELGYDASHAVQDVVNLFPYLLTGTRARLAQQDLAAAQDWVDRVGTDLRLRPIPGTMPALDHADGLLHLAAGRTGKARELLGSAHEQWTRRRRWWEAQWCAVDLARCGMAANRRTEASSYAASVRETASPVSAIPLLDAAAEVAARLDRHDDAQPWSPLTLRELDVARLVARGLTNKEIAEQLRITARTAGSHLEHIRAKIGASRRSEIAAWVMRVDAAGTEAP